MPTMQIKQEIEVTPEVAKQHLVAFADAGQRKSFPHPRGAFLRLKDDAVKALGVLPGLPALVLTNAEGTPLGCVAVCKAEGTAMIFVVESQVEGVWAD